MMRLEMLGHVFVPALAAGCVAGIVLAGAGVAADEQDETLAIAEIARAGGTIECDDKLPGRPVIEATLGNRAGDNDLRWLQSLKKLSSLNLHNTRVTDSGLKALSELKNLTALEFLRNQRITDEGLKNLRELKNLTSLDFHHNPTITDSSCKALGELKNLTTLGLADTNVTGAGLKQLKGLKKLKALDLGRNKLTDADLKELREFKELTTLELYLNRSITDAGLKELNGFTDLKELNLNGIPITGIGLNELKDLKQLTILHIDMAPVSEMAVDRLKTALPKLQIKGNRLVRFPKGIQPRRGAPLL